MATYLPCFGCSALKLLEPFPVRPHIILGQEGPHQFQSMMLSYRGHYLRLTRIINRTNGLTPRAWEPKEELGNQFKLEFRILKKCLSRFGLRNWFQWAGSFISEWFSQSMSIGMIKTSNSWWKVTLVLKILSDQLLTYSPPTFNQPKMVSWMMFLFFSLITFSCAIWRNNFYRMFQGGKENVSFLWPFLQLIMLCWFEITKSTPNSNRQQDT